eukprot:6205376-Pleurochrysis_carterae.AAC.3
MATVQYIRRDEGGSYVIAHRFAYSRRYTSYPRYAFIHGLAVNPMMQKIDCHSHIQRTSLML